MPLPHRPCPCAESYAAHSINEVVRAVTVSAEIIHRLRTQLEVGRQIAGRWHFSAAELDLIRETLRTEQRHAARRRAARYHS